MRGKKFVQASLKSDFQNEIAGQSAIAKFLLLTFAACLSILSGGFAAITGGFISLYTIFPQIPDQRWMMLGATLIVLAALLKSLQQSFLQGLHGAVTASIMMTILVVIGLRQTASELLVGIAVFSLLLGATALLSLLAGGLSMALLLTLLDRPKKATYIYAALTIFIAIVFADVLIGSLKSRASFPNELSLRILAVCTGLIFSSSAIVMSKVIAVSIAKQFEFFRAWALGISCWRSTSFYDLDLSGVDFTNAKLANADLRAKTLYRTCFQGVSGLDRAKVDRRYLDLDDLKVQQLLTCGNSSDHNFRRCNLQGAYLQGAEMRGFDLTDANLTGVDLREADLRNSILIRVQLADADLQTVDLRSSLLMDANLTGASLREADLRGCILVRAQVARADFTGSDLTGICIEDWSVSSKTQFTNVRCNYIYRKYQNAQSSDRYPVDRDFEPEEFASLFAEPEDIVELVFKGAFDIAALSLALYKLQLDAPELNLELRGVEQRGNLWVAKIKSTSTQLNEQLIMERLTSVYQAPNLEATIKSSIYRDYEETRQRLAESEQLVKQLAGVTGSQAEALKELSKRSLGNNFFISGSTITNLTGSGQIEYNEAAQQIRQLVTNQADPHPILQQLRDRKIALTPETQTEFIQQMLVSEAEKDPIFKQFLLQQGQQMIENLPDSIAIAISSTIAQLS
jgi:uncharacterized protein YjbI with pentapeptide repeats